MGVSHQAQGGKSSENLALSRNCDETENESLSQDARRLSLSVSKCVCEVQIVFYVAFFLEFNRLTLPPLLRRCLKSP